MNGKDLISNLIDELSRARELLRLYVDGVEVPKTTSEELINDIDSDLDRFYDVADSINVCVEDIEIDQQIKGIFYVEMEVDSK